MSNSDRRVVHFLADSLKWWYTPCGRHFRELDYTNRKRGVSCKQCLEAMRREAERG